MESKSVKIRALKEQTRGRTCRGWGRKVAWECWEKQGYEEVRVCERESECEGMNTKQ